MKKLSKLMTALLLAFGFAFAGFTLNSTISAHGTEGEEQTSSTNTEATEAENSNVTYSYVAQPGDSYSWIARKAVQTYGLKEDVKLTQAQILAAETALTLAANSPVLNEGQTVTVSEDAVHEAVDAVKNLSEADQAGWAAYVPFVNFNTDNVGERR